MILLVLLNTILLASAFNNTANGIPKIVWTFWDSGLTSASLFTRMCVNNMQYYTRISGWDFRFLSNQNYTQHISKQGLERMDRMYTQSKHKISKQNWADIMRLTLIYENGGMWLDTNSFFIGNLSWIQNIEKEKWPYNRLTDQADIITFTLNSAMGGNRTVVYDKQLKQNIYLIPGLEIWSFISKPKSIFLQQVLNRLEYSLKTSRQILDKQAQGQKLVFGRQKDPYYITSNYLFQTVLQKKQRQLQRNSSPSNNTKYAVQYYKMWSIAAQDTIYGIFSAYNWFTFSIINSILKQSVSDFLNNYNIPPYFIKFNGGNYPHANNALIFHEFAKCMGVDVNIKEGSVLDQFMIKRNEEVPQIKKIREMYQLGYMDNNSCEHNDASVFSYLRQLKEKAYFCILIVVAYHVVLFYFVRRANTKHE